MLHVGPGLGQPTDLLLRPVQGRYYLSNRKGMGTTGSQSPGGHARGPCADTPHADHERKSEGTIDTWGPSVNNLQADTWGPATSAGTTITGNHHTQRRDNNRELALDHIQ